MPWLPYAGRTEEDTGEEIEGAVLTGEPARAGGPGGRDLSGSDRFDRLAGTSFPGS
jgi:hypothetical protein